MRKLILIYKKETLLKNMQKFDFQIKANITEEERFEIIQNKSPEILNLIEEYRVIYNSNLVLCVRIVR